MSSVPSSLSAYNERPRHASLFEGSSVSEKTLIGWTDASWNPWSGCTKVSAGCDNCYMFTLKRRWGADPEAVARSKTTFRDPLKWKQPHMVFTCSMSDFFHVDADPWRDEAWEIIRKTPHHTYQILTKRPGRIARHLPADWGEGYRNVWLGVSVENQKAVSRVRVLQGIPVGIRFISAEPLLGAIEFPSLDGIHWIISGGESGPKRRTMEMEWLQGVFDQARLHGLAMYTKQDSGAYSEMRGRIPDSLWAKEFPGNVA